VVLVFSATALAFFFIYVFAFGFLMDHLLVGRGPAEGAAFSAYFLACAVGAAATALGVSYLFGRYWAWRK